ncbi:MAG TPA: hypothetical protein VNA27_16605 [Rubrobacteraceae bacterium]|nr:hypothetical protein [Rubrobacteraceae bacterium]
MRACSVDLLRRKVVDAVRRGGAKAEVARAFGVGHSSVLYRALWPWCAALAASLAGPIWYTPRLSGQRLAG